MKSIATFLSSSKKKDKDRDKDSKLRAGDFLAPDPRPTNIFRRTPSPAPSSSTSSLRKHTFGFGTNTESRRQQHQEQPQRPALSRSFFRSVVDVSRIAHASSGNNGHHSSERGSPVVDSPAPSELGTLAPERPPRTDATYPGSMRPSDTIMDDVYDPFAAHYQPPPRLEKPRVPSPPSPPRLLPRLAEVPQGQRPRALSLGSAARPPCPAHVLGPLPPLPQLPPSLKVPQPSTTNGLEGDASPPKSAPPQVVSFPTSRARSGSTSKTSLVGVSSDKTITRGPSRLSAKTISPTDSVGSSLTDSSSAPVIGSRSGSGDSPGRSSVSQSRRLTKAPVPQLEQTWQRFLHEVEEDSQTLVPPSNFSKSTIQLVPSTSSRASIVSRSKAASKPRAPPPSRPLPSLPPAAPLNIRRRERAQTMVTSNSKGSPPSRLILPKTSKSGDLQQMSPFTPPISPPASAGPRQFFDNLLDVIVTPAHAQDGPSAKVSTPPSCATSSSLPYLCSSASRDTIPAKSVSPCSDYSRDPSELSLSLFPAPPQLPLRVPSPEERYGENPRPPSTTTDRTITPSLPTPPITPLNLDFPLYAASSASHSTTTIRPPSCEERESGHPLTSTRLHDIVNTSGASDCSSEHTACTSFEHDDLLSSGTTICSHDPDSSADSTLRSSTDTDRSEASTSAVSMAVRSVHKAHRARATRWDGPPSPERQLPGHRTFHLLPTFVFDPLFSDTTPSTPVKPRSSIIARHERLIHLLHANNHASSPRTPGSPFTGRGVEWGEAL